MTEYIANAHERAVTDRANALATFTDPNGEGPEVSAQRALVHALLAIEARIEELTTCLPG